MKMNNRKRASGTTNGESQQMMMNGNGASSPSSSSSDNTNKHKNGIMNLHGTNGAEKKTTLRSASLTRTARGSRGSFLLVLCLGSMVVLFLMYIHHRRAHYIPTEPPSSMIFRGKKGYYDKVPPEFRRTFHIPEGTKFRRTVARAFRYNNFRKVDSPEEANFIIDKGEDPWRYPRLKSWQRYNNIPGTKQVRVWIAGAMCVVRVEHSCEQQGHEFLHCFSCTSPIPNSSNPKVSVAILSLKLNVSASSSIHDFLHLDLF